MTNKMSPRPPMAKTADDFIEAAGSKKPKLAKDDLPWLQPGVRDDILKIMSLRMTEPYHLKLKYIADNTKYSQTSFGLEVVQKAIDAKIGELIAGDVK